MYGFRMNFCLVLAALVGMASSGIASAQNYGSVRQRYSPGIHPMVHNQGISQANFSAVNHGRVAIPWYQSLIKEREYDFGVVATASKQEHIFEFENTTGSKLLLTSVRTSCGCTKPSVLTPEVNPGETGRVKAILETRKFQGERGATLSVSVQRIGQTVEYGEFQFAVRGKIRKDVVFNPGEVAFKEVSMSLGSSRAVRVSYAGNPNWKITEIKSTSPHLTVESKETRRDLQTGRINYELLVKLDASQPAGPLSEFLTIVTNDHKTTGMPIRVTGQVKPELEAAPIQLGVVNQGQVLKKKWIVRSKTAFKITRITSNNPAIAFEPSEGEKTLHIINYTLDTSRVGQVDDEVTIVTGTASNSPTRVKFSAQIVASTMAGNREPTP